MTDRTASGDKSQQHDPHCPKSFPTRMFPDAETGDPWTMGPTKLLCQCDQITAARKAGPGGLDLHMVYVRNQLCEIGESAAPEEDELLRDLDRVVNLAAKVIRREDAWYWVRAPNAALAGAVPLDLIAAGEQQRVVDLLAALAKGVTD